MSNKMAMSTQGWTLGMAVVCLIGQSDHCVDLKTLAVMAFFLEGRSINLRVPLRWRSDEAEGFIVS